MDDPILFIAGIVAAGAWLTAVYSCISMVRHRAPGVSVGYLLTHGLAFFSGDKFTPEASKYRGWFLRSAGLFLACVFALGLLSALRTGR